MYVGSNLPEVLLISCYELGHQPFSLASPLKFLRNDGINAAAIDLAVENLSDYEEHIKCTRLVLVSVRMHNALRLGVTVSKRVRALNPQTHICFYGDYAGLNADYLCEEQYADSTISGEFEPAIVELARAVLEDAFQQNRPPSGVRTYQSAAKPVLQRTSFMVPERADLPQFGSYARFRDDKGELHLAGSTETTRGCKYVCRHCPVTSVYQGKFFVVPEDVVIADIRNQVDQGVRHISFSDPDFLNGPSHARRVVASMHAEFPEITFDFTARIPHLLKHKHLLPEMKIAGCAFVISALETLNDDVLDVLEKGHTKSDIIQVLGVMKKAQIPWRPSLLPFTPWATLDDYLELLDFVRDNDLMQNIDPVQFSLRLLIPPGSALLEQHANAEWLDDLDAANFTYKWAHPDVRMEQLWSQINTVVRQSQNEDIDHSKMFSVIEELACAMIGKTPPFTRIVSQIRPIPAGLTESWFC